jgi:hypothetical protein
MTSINGVSRHAALRHPETMKMTRLAYTADQRTQLIFRAVHFSDGDVSVIA